MEIRMPNNICQLKNILFVVILLLLCSAAGACISAPIPSPQDKIPLPVPEPPRMKPPIIIVFEVSPSKVTLVEPVTLKWEVTGADTVSIDQGIGQVSSSGTKKLVPAQSIVYKLTAVNSGGNITRTASVIVYENINASKLALNEDDVKSAGFGLRRNTEPKIDDTISTYSATFLRRGNTPVDELLDNSVFIYNTVTATEKRYIETKSNAKGSLPNIVVIGDEGYILKIPGADQNELATYAIRFRKNNVFVNVGTLPNLKELESFARIVEGRIK
jgi:hypothetical protein